MAKSSPGLAGHDVIPIEWPTISLPNDKIICSENGMRTGSFPVYDEHAGEYEIQENQGPAEESNCCYTGVCDWFFCCFGESKTNKDDNVTQRDGKGNYCCVSCGEISDCNCGNCGNCNGCEGGCEGDCGCCGDCNCIGCVDVDCGDCLLGCCEAAGSC